MTERPHPPVADALREAESGATERLRFFSDAVVAIAMTLLAIELPVPEPGTVREMLDSAVDQLAIYLAFLVSFWVIAQHWRAHHFLFHLIGRSSRRLITLNIVWLFLIVITPFTTKLLSEGTNNILRFGTYAVTQTAQAVVFVLMVIEIRRENLLIESGDDSVTTPGISRSLVFAAAFLVSIPVYLLWGDYAFFVWFALPVLFGLMRRFTARRTGDTMMDTGG